MQRNAAASDQPAYQNQRYLDAVNRLAAADRYEEARYHELVGQPQKAIGAYTEAIEFLPGLATAYWNRGRLYLSHLKDKTKAASDFNAALQVYSSNADNHMKSGEYQECIDDIESALALNADFAKAYYQRAACRIGLGEQDGAREDFIRAARLGDQGARDILVAKGVAW
jgi:tetratricopeptide (TPR) repeat protein